jgi:hypothetical protein
VTLDNVKTLRFSWDDLEAIISSDVLSGRQLYQGEGQRPNTLTWVITLNNASLSKDMAQRVVPIRLERPPHAPAWREETAAFIDEHRWEIIGDILAELKRTVEPLASYSRWAAWERDVLSRVGEPSECQKVIKERQGEVDDDQTETDLTRGAFVEDLKARGFDPDTAAVWYPASLAAELVNRALGEKLPTARATSRLKTLNVPELRKGDQKGERGWAWRGSDASPSASLHKLAARPFVGTAS